MGGATLIDIGVNNRNLICHRMIIRAAPNRGREGGRAYVGILAWGTGWGRGSSYVGILALHFKPLKCSRMSVMLPVSKL